jgi:hypothetical protein
MSFLLSSPGTTNLPDVFQKYPKRGSNTNGEKTYAKEFEFS